MDSKDLHHLAWIRNRLAALLAGDSNVDVGILVWELNKLVVKAGGDPSPTLITAKSRFFTEEV